MIVPAHLVSIDLYFFDNFVDHPSVLPNRKRDRVRDHLNVFLKMVTWFAHRTEICFGTKDTFVD